jgi:hypothetical protein
MRPLVPDSTRRIPNQKPETRNQKPETRNQKPETRNQNGLFWFLVSGFWFASPQPLDNVADDQRRVTLVGPEGAERNGSCAAVAEAIVELHD